MTVTSFNMPQTISIALLVIAGEFGTGNDRKKKLASAGYDSTQVQNCVNELLPIINKYGG